MPVSFTLTGRLLTIRCIGSYTVDELRAPWLAVTSKPELTLPIACVLDASESDSVLGRSIDDMRSIAEAFMLRASLTDRRLALVARGAARYGLMRMAATWVELSGIEARVFRDLTEAQHWALSRLAASEHPDSR